MPPKKTTIFPQISAEANALLMRVCEAQGCLPGAVVEAALQALLDPREVTDRDRLLIQGQRQLHEDMVAMLSFHKKLLALLEAQQPEQVTIAAFEDLYAEEDLGKEMSDDSGAVPSPVEEVPQPGGWRKLFPRREQR